MYTYTSIKIGAHDDQPQSAPTVQAFLEVLEATDWTTIMGRWLETQETPLPAYVLQHAKNSATLSVSRICHDDVDYYQLMFFQRVKAGLFKKKMVGLSTELHAVGDMADFAECFWEGRFDELQQRMHAKGVNTFA